MLRCNKLWYSIPRKFGSVAIDWIYSSALLFLVNVEWSEFSIMYALSGFLQIRTDIHLIIRRRQLDKNLSNLI